MKDAKNYDCLKLDRQLCFPLYAAARRVIGRYGEPLASLGLTYTQYLTMMVLWEEECVSVKSLGARLYLDSGTLTPLLKVLEKKGLVTRARSKDDERVVLVALTKEGKALRERALSVPGQVAACVKLDPDDARQLYVLLHKLLDSFDEQERQENQHD